MTKLHYVYFDFHNETKGLQWHRAQLLLDQLKQGLVNGQYFRGMDMPADTQGPFGSPEPADCRGEDELYGLSGSDQRCSGR